MRNIDTNHYGLAFYIYKIQGEEYFQIIKTSKKGSFPESSSSIVN